jgi:hypothetical protein
VESEPFPKCVAGAAQVRGALPFACSRGDLIQSFQAPWQVQAVADRVMEVVP